MIKLINITGNISNERLKAINFINHSINREVYSFVYKDFFNTNIESLINGTINIRDNVSLLKIRGMVEEQLIRQFVFYETISSNTDNTYVDILNLLESLKESDWNDNPYHNKDHTRTVLTNMILNSKTPLPKELLVATVFHDIKYSIYNKENENIKIACDYACDFLSGKEYTSSFIEEVVDIIKNKHELYPILLKSDLSHFIRTVEEIIEIEKLIFKEYSKYDFYFYRKERNKILKEISLNSDTDIQNGIEIALGWLNTFEPKIGWFCGSFAPLHVGHIDILDKAKTIFDKVVLVRGYNPDKKINLSDYPLDSIDELKFIEIIELSKQETIPDRLNSKKYIPTMIRGIRNVNDLIEAQTWIKQINELNENLVNMFLIDGDSSLNHISSSFLRAIQNKKQYNTYSKIPNKI